VGKECCGTNIYLIIYLLKARETYRSENYRGIKLMNHCMQIWEKIIDKKIRSEIPVTKYQFAFMPGKSTMEQLFCMRQLIKKYWEKK